MIDVVEIYRDCFEPKIMLRTHKETHQNDQLRLNDHAVAFAQLMRRMRNGKYEIVTRGIDRIFICIELSNGKPIINLI